MRFHELVRFSSRLFYASFLATQALLVTGCADSLTQSGRKANGDVVPYESPRFFLLSPLGPVSVTVTTRSPPDVPQKSSKELLWLLLGGLTLAPLGLVAPPLYAGALVVGGGLVATGAGAGYVGERWTFNTIAVAVRESNLPAALADALRAYALPLDGQNEPTADITVAVQGWGLAGECVVASVELSVSRDGLLFLTDQLNLTIADRSSDAPPVQCASISKFAENNGRLVHDTIRDYAEVLAVMVTDRVNRLQP